MQTCLNIKLFVCVHAVHACMPHRYPKGCLRWVGEICVCAADLPLVNVYTHIKCII